MQSCDADGASLQPKWKVTQIIMLQKPENSAKLAESRPILLFILLKLFEKLLLAKLSTIIEDYKLISSNQFDFSRKS
jgi:hypothetical protein